MNIKATFKLVCNRCRHEIIEENLEKEDIQWESIKKMADEAVKDIRQGWD